MRAPSPALLLPMMCLMAVVAAGQGVKSRAKMPSCEAVCAGLAAAIRQSPDKLVMRLEDALVINESCTADIVATAIDAVNADPLKVRKIYETAVNVVPHRAGQVRQAVASFSVPAAVEAPAVAFEVRRAELPNGRPPPAFEVRRAEVAGLTARTPVPEVRRAEIPGREEVRRAVVVAESSPARSGKTAPRTKRRR
ncbi:MAG: hypothetical protein HS117_00790 [Verrucomicrobiaceae bacterium]|nr:hypothetical protein [Verrucomicrobiaceae bacterium]